MPILGMAMMNGHDNAGREMDRRHGDDRRAPTTWWGKLPDAWKLALTAAATATAFFTAGLSLSNRVAIQDQLPPRVSALETRIAQVESSIVRSVDARTADRRLLLYVACRVDGLIADECVRNVLNPALPTSDAVEELLLKP